MVRRGSATEIMCNVSKRVSFSLLSLFTCFAHSRLSRRSSTRNGSEGCPFSCKAEPAGLLTGGHKTSARQHPAAFPPQAYSANRPAAPSPRPPTAQANGHRLPHAPRAGWREVERLFYSRERRSSGLVSDIKETANHFLPRSLSDAPMRYT